MSARIFQRIVTRSWRGWEGHRERPKGELKNFYFFKLIIELSVDHGIKQSARIQEDADEAEAEEEIPMVTTVTKHSSIIFL